MKYQEFFRKFLEVLKNGNDFSVDFFGGKNMVFKSGKIFVQCAEKEGRMVVADTSGVINAFCFSGSPFYGDFSAFCQNAREYCLQKESFFEARRLVPSNVQRGMLFRVNYSQTPSIDFEPLLRKVESLSSKYKAKEIVEAINKKKKLMQKRMMMENEYEYE